MDSAKAVHEGTVLDPFTQYSEDQRACMGDAVAGLLQQWGQTCEAKHLQPVLIQVLSVLNRAVGCRWHIADTHNRSVVGIEGYIDCTLLAPETLFFCPGVVSFGYHVLIIMVVRNTQTIKRTSHIVLAL